MPTTRTVNLATLASGIANWPRHCAQHAVGFPFTIEGPETYTANGETHTSGPLAYSVGPMEVTKWVFESDSPAEASDRASTWAHALAVKARGTAHESSAARFCARIDGAMEASDYLLARMGKISW